MNKLVSLLIAFLPLLVMGQSDVYPKGYAHRIVVIGSSTAAGHGPSSPDSTWVNRYRAYLKSFNPDNEVINLAKGGYTSYHLMPTDYSPPVNRALPDPARNITQALSLHPTAIIVNMPSNDVSSDVANEAQLSNFATFERLAKEAGVSIWMTTTQPVNFKEEYKRKRQLEMQGLMLQRFQHPVDFWTGFDSTNQMLKQQFNSGDGTHMNNAGHRILFNRIVEQKITSDSSNPFLKYKLIKFKDTTLLKLPFVNPVAVDKPYALPMFYDIEEYKTIKFSGWINDVRLFATRTWEEESFGDRIRYIEKIDVRYKPDNSVVKTLLHGNHSLRGQYIGLKGEVLKEWTISSTNINYETAALSHTYMLAPKSVEYQLKINAGQTENIKFLNQLCFFYLENSQDGTRFKVVPPTN